MHAFRKPSLVAEQPQSPSESSGDGSQSPQASASATSGTYLRAVRPTAAEAAALARGELLIDCAKIEGLRFEVEVGVWRGDAERIAHRIIDDAECSAAAAEGDNDDE